jgi:hypothetical protein
VCPLHRIVEKSVHLFVQSLDLLLSCLLELGVCNTNNAHCSRGQLALLVLVSGTDATPHLTIFWHAPERDQAGPAVACHQRLGVAAAGRAAAVVNLERSDRAGTPLSSKDVCPGT